MMISKFLMQLLLRTELQVTQRCRSQKYFGVHLFDQDLFTLTKISFLNVYQHHS